MWTTTTGDLNLERIVLRRNLVRLGRLGPAKTTSTAGGDETDLGTSRTIATDRRGVTNVLVVTTPVRVLNRVHSHTTHLRPAVALNLVLVVAGTSLKHRLVATTTTRDLTDRRAATRRNRLLAPDGSLIREKPVSRLWEIKMQYSPDALAKVPRSPSLDSTLQMIVPSGMELSGKTLPIANCAFLPAYTN